MEKENKKHHRLAFSSHSEYIRNSHGSGTDTSDISEGDEDEPPHLSSSAPPNRKRGRKRLKSLDWPWRGGRPYHRGKSFDEARAFAINNHDWQFSRDPPMLRSTSYHAGEEDEEEEAEEGK